MSGRVVVLGSINVDLLASVERLPLAGETVAGDRLTRQLGGKGANQAVAAARAGAASILIAAVGDDADGLAMIETLAGFNVNVADIRRASGATGHALVMTSASDNQIVVIPGANALVDERLASKVEWRPGDIALTQMETPPLAAAAFLQKARSAGATTLVNAAPASDTVIALLSLTDILIVNKSELGLLCNTSLGTTPSDADLKSAIENSTLSAVPTVIVTLGANGVVLASDGKLTRISGLVAKVVDTTGAGDCFCGYLAAALARGEVLESAILEANVAASVAVQSLGAASSMPTRSQILPAVLAAQAKV